MSAKSAQHASDEAAIGHYINGVRVADADRLAPVTNPALSLIHI